MHCKRVGVSVSARCASHVTCDVDISIPHDMSRTWILHECPYDCGVFNDRVSIRVQTQLNYRSAIRLHDKD